MDDIRSIYKQHKNIDIKKHVELKTSILEYKQPRALSPIFEDKKFIANVNAKNKFKKV